MHKYTREELINLCLAGSVPQDKWHNRDSARAQMQLGENLMLLMAGCDFTVTEVRKKTIWVDFEVKGFDWFEEHIMSSEFGYIPTQERLDEVNGEDWY